MAKLPTIVEIRKMSVQDILSEVANIRHEAAKVRLTVELSKEKDTSKMKKLRRHLAQLLTVLQEKNSEAPKKSEKSLSKPSKVSKIPARA